MNRCVVNPATQTMLNNGDYERIRIVTTPTVGPSDARIYIYDLDHRIVGEYGGAGVTDVKAEYIWTLPEVGASGPTGGDDGAGGYMPLAIVSGTTSAINWVHSHHNAKPILLTNSTGTIVAYTGHAVLGFPGQFANAVGLAGAQYYYNRYRDYNDVMGRYTQADPIGLAGDANPYAYAMGNTLRYVDPSGEIAWFIPILGAAAFGAGTDLAYQAIMNGLNNRPVFNANCYDWRQVAISGGLGAFTGGAAAWLNRGARIAVAAGNVVPQVTSNRIIGNAWRDELAAALRAAGRGLETEVFKPTLFGKRFIDIQVSDVPGGTILGGIEAKVANSRYLPSQRATDAWLKMFDNYPVNVARGPRK